MADWTAEQAVPAGHAGPAEHAEPAGHAEPAAAAAVPCSALHLLL